MRLAAAAAAILIPPCSASSSVHLPSATSPLPLTRSFVLPDPGDEGGVRPSLPARWGGRTGPPWLSSRCHLRPYDITLPSPSPSPLLSRRPLALSLHRRSAGCGQRPPPTRRPKMDTSQRRKIPPAGARSGGCRGGGEERPSQALDASLSRSILLRQGRNLLLEPLLQVAAVAELDEVMASPSFLGWLLLLCPWCPGEARFVPIK